MNDQDYREILGTIRRRLRDLGLGTIDELIITNMRGSEGAFWDLERYLKHLREEVRLGSDFQYRETMRRMGRYVVTESKQPLRGIRIELSEEEQARYQMRYLDIAPNQEMGRIAEELGVLLAELRNDREPPQQQPRGPEIDL